MGVSYTYSSDGTQLTKTVNGVKTSYTWDGSQLVSQKTGNEAIYFLSVLVSSTKETPTTTFTISKET